MRRYFGFAVRMAMAAVVIALVACADVDGGIEPMQEPEYEMSRTQQQEVHAAWRVDMILTSDESNEMLSEYTYDADDRLVKINFTNQNKGDDRIIDTQFESSFEWQDGLMVRQHGRSRYQDYSFGYDRINEFETIYGYDDAGRLMHEGRDYRYDEQGRLVQTYSFEFGGIIYADELVWDEGGNVTRHICPRPEQSDAMEPVEGTYTEQIFEYEYDNMPKPNFGTGEGMFWDGRFNPWPFAGNSDEQMARTLSRNNLTRCRESGYAYRYTYNEHGLPATVQELWIGPGEIDKTTILTILYKRADQ